MLDIEWLLKPLSKIETRTSASRVQWPTGDTIDVRVLLDGDQSSLTLSFTANEKPVLQQFVLTRAPTQVGGARWSVKCPETGKMVRDLYLASGVGEFRSRHALRLTYRWKKINASDRHRARAERLMARIGAVDADDEPPRPKYMRRWTYRMLLSKIRDKYAPTVLAVQGWSLDNFVDEEDGVKYRPPPRKSRRPNSTL